MKKELHFRSERYGANKSAQRDKIRYTVAYSAWYEGRSTSGKLPHHITRYDMQKKDYINTENVKRFATEEEAVEFCQELYEGKTDLEALRAEIQKDIAEREREKNEIASRGAERFKDALCMKKVTLTDFLELMKIWNDTPDASRRLL